uniref:Glucodextranase-like C-terminal domain-containing protein n=1 Tax=Thermofilum pendens TaxID=2269 RepID=A0A7J3X7F1_THEPE
MRSTSKLLFAVLLLVLLSPLALKLAEAQAPVVQVGDPAGDDKGPGFYGYPGADVFKPGVFDVVKFEVYVDEKTVTFKVHFKDLGGNPWGGKNGFCLQQVHIYIRADAPANVPARASAVAVNLNFDPSWAWHYAILIGPCWETPPEPLPSGQCTVVYRPFDEVVQDDLLKVAVEGNAIVATVDKAVFTYGDIANIKSWKFVIAVASHDGFGPLRVRPVGIGKEEWLIWGTATADDKQKVAIANAIKFGIEPRVLDIAVYSPEFPNGITAEQQYAWLSSFDPDTKTPATLPPVIAQQISQLKSQLASVTKERDDLKAQVSSLQGQVSSLQGQVSSLQSQVRSLQDENAKLRGELEELRATTMSTGLAVAIAVVLLVVGAAAGYFLGKRKPGK